MHPLRRARKPRLPGGNRCPTGLERLFAATTSADPPLEVRSLGPEDGSADTAFADDAHRGARGEQRARPQNDYPDLRRGRRSSSSASTTVGRDGDPPDVPQTDAFTLPHPRTLLQGRLGRRPHPRRPHPRRPVPLPVIDQSNDHGVIELYGMFDATGRRPTSPGASAAQLAGWTSVQLSPEIVLINPTEENQIMGASPDLRFKDGTPARRSAAPPGGGCLHARDGRGITVGDLLCREIPAAASRWRPELHPATMVTAGDCVFWIILLRFCSSG